MKQIKYEIMSLYKKNSVLAKKVSKILGYKIISKKINLSKIHKELKQASTLIVSAFGDLNNYYSEEVGKTPDSVNKLGLDTLQTLGNLKVIVKNLIEKNKQK